MNDVLALVCCQAAQDEAWVAWLSNVPMSWLTGITVGENYHG
jgi:hypothetical protein